MTMHEKVLQIQKRKRQESQNHDPDEERTHRFRP